MGSPAPTSHCRHLSRGQSQDELSPWRAPARLFKPCLSRGKQLLIQQERSASKRHSGCQGREAMPLSWITIQVAILPDGSTMTSEAQEEKTCKMDPKKPE